MRPFLPTILLLTLIAGCLFADMPAYAQKDPLIEYKREAFGLFADLNERIDRDALYAMFHARVAATPRPAADLARARAVHREAASALAAPRPQ